MSRLKTYHLDLLQRLSDEGALPLEDLDGRVLRPLRSLGLVELNDGTAAVTRAGRDRAAEQGGATEDLANLKLSRAQEDLLRAIIRQRGVPAEDADKRTVRVLRSRGLIREEDDLVVATASGHEALASPRQQDKPGRRGRKPVRNPRAEAIFKAADELDRLIPPGSEVLVGSILAAADDVVAGFRALARRKQDATKRQMS